MKFNEGNQARFGKGNDYSIFPADWKVEHKDKSTIFKSPDGKRFNTYQEAKAERERELEAFIPGQMQPKANSVMFGCTEEEGIFISQVSRMEIHLT